MLIPVGPVCAHAQLLFCDWSSITCSDILIESKIYKVNCKLFALLLLLITTIQESLVRVKAINLGILG